MSTTDAIGFCEFKDWAKDNGVNLRIDGVPHEGDWTAWWECWKNGFEQGFGRAIEQER